MIALHKYKLEGVRTMPMSTNDNGIGNYEANLEEGRQLTKTLIDIAGIIQSRFLDFNCGRHADIIFEVRYLLGQVFDVPVIEIDIDALKLDVSRKIRHFNLLDVAS